MVLLFLVNAFAAGCPEDALGAVRASAARMEVTFVQLEEETFDEAHAVLDRALPCVDRPLERPDVLAVHRAMALGLFMDGDMRASTKAWGAVKAIDPGWLLPPAMGPEGHLLRRLFDAATEAGGHVTLELEPPGGWIVDGAWTSDVPAERAFVLQALGDDGVYYTGYELSVAGVPVTDLVQPGPSPRARKVRKLGSGTAAGLALACGALVLVYADARSAVYEVPYERIGAVRARGNTAGGVAIGLGAASVGVFTVAWAVRW